MEERRAAARSLLPEPIEANVSGIDARIVEISRVGLRLEHEGRLTVGASLKLAFTWAGVHVVQGVSVVRSEVMGRGETGLRYASGVKFVESSTEVDLLLTSLIGWAESGGPRPTAADVMQAMGASSERLRDSVAAAAPTAAKRIATPPGRPVSSFLRSSEPAEEEARFLQTRLTETGWVTERVSGKAQPDDDGFTILATRRDELEDLQKTYQYADPETRRMIRFAMEAELARE